MQGYFSVWADPEQTHTHIWSSVWTDPEQNTHIRFSLWADPEQTHTHASDLLTADFNTSSSCTGYEGWSEGWEQLSCPERSPARRSSESSSSSSSVCPHSSWRSGASTPAVKLTHCSTSACKKKKKDFITKPPFRGTAARQGWTDV